MSHLLRIDSSLRTEGSRSRKLTARYVERWRAAHPGGVVTTRDLAADPVPHLDLATHTAGFLAPADRTEEQIAGYARRSALVDEVLAADEIVIGLPLYNFGPPSAFKAWFDHIVDLDRTAGKLGEKGFVVLAASGGGYGPGTPREGWDHREPWLRHALSTLGVEQAVFIGAELTLARESPAMVPLDLGGLEDKSLADALAAIDRLVEHAAAA